MCTLRHWCTLCSRHSSCHTLKGQESIQKSKSCNLCLMTTYHSQWIKPTTVLFSHPHPTFYAFMLALLAHALHVIATSNFKPELSWVLRLCARNVLTLAVTQMNRILLGWIKSWYGYTILRSNCLHILLWEQPQNAKQLISTTSLNTRVEQNLMSCHGNTLNCTVHDAIRWHLSHGNVL